MSEFIVTATLRLYTDWNKQHLEDFDLSWSYATMKEAEEKYNALTLDPRCYLLQLSSGGAIIKRHVRPIEMAY